MAIKLKDAVAVVKKRFASGARNMSPLQMKTGKTTQLWSRVKPRPTISVGSWWILKKSLRFLSITTMRFIVFSAKMRRTPCGKI